MKVVSLSALDTGRLYPSGNNPGTHFYQRPSRSRARVRLEGLCQREFPMNPPGIEPTTFWLVAD